MGWGLFVARGRLQALPDSSDVLIPDLLFNPGLIQPFSMLDGFAESIFVLGVGSLVSAPVGRLLLCPP